MEAEAAALAAVRRHARSSELQKGKLTSPPEIQDLCRVPDLFALLLISAGLVPLLVAPKFCNNRNIV
jgi:hypothetical protein